MKFNFEDTKYDISVASKFKSDYKKLKKQNRNIKKLEKINWF